MIVYCLLQAFDTIVFFVISLFPTLETPVYIANALPQILRTVMGFNLYFPIYEAIIGVILCISFTFGFKCFSIVASKAGLSI